MNKTRFTNSTFVESWQIIDVCDTSMFDDGEFDAVLRTGDLRHMGGTHVCQMFRSRDITELVERCGGQVLSISGSNWSFREKSEALVQLEIDADRWRRFLEHEIAACQELGVLDGGTHILFAAKRD